MEQKHIHTYTKAEVSCCTPLLSVSRAATISWVTHNIGRLVPVGTGWGGWWYIGTSSSYNAVAMDQYTIL